MFVCKSAAKQFLPPRLRTSLPVRPPTLSNIRRFTSTPWARMTLLSPERALLQLLDKSKHDKWGYVIYRCTYKNDQDWDRFKQLVHTRFQEYIAKSDTPQIAESLEFTFVEDRATLDGASRGQLRKRFNEWAAQALSLIHI